MPHLCRLLRRQPIDLSLAVVLLAATPAAAQDAPHLFAAATLRAAVDSTLQVYKQTVGEDAVAVFGPTPALAKQIEAGAPADLLLAADDSWMDALANEGLLHAGTRVELLGNHLVLVGPVDGPDLGTLAPGSDLPQRIGAGRIAMCDPMAHPAGRYARAGFETLGLWPALQDHLAIAADPAAAVTLVARGEAMAAVAFATDAAGVMGVKVSATFPPASHPPIRYPLAAIGTGRSPGAMRLLAFLRSRAAQAIFERDGYLWLDQAEGTP